MLSPQAIAQKYINMLPKSNWDQETMPMPNILMVNVLSANWNGIALWDGKSEKSTIKIQKKLLKDERSLSRIIAHEVCHAWAYWKVWKGEAKRPWHNGHRPSGGWAEAAHIINQREGEDFVTEVSDLTYVVENEKPFWIFVERQRGGEPYWAWFSRVTDNMAGSMRRRIDRAWADGREVGLAKVTDARFLLPGAKLPTVATYREVPPDVTAMLEQVLQTQPISPGDTRDIKTLVGTAGAITKKSSRRPIHFSR